MVIHLDWLISNFKIMDFGSIFMLSKVDADDAITTQLQPNVLSRGLHFISTWAGNFIISFYCF